MTKEQTFLHDQDPEPVSLALTTLGAVGSITTLAAFAVQMVDRHRASKRQRREAMAPLIEHFADAEAGLTELASILARVRIIAGLSEVQPVLGKIGMEPTQGQVCVGEYNLLMSEARLKQYLKLQDDAFRHSRQVQKALSQALMQLYRVEVKLPQDSFNKLVSIVREVNRALGGSESVKAMLEKTEKIVNEAAALMRDLRMSFTPDLDPGTSSGMSLG